jgi:hypothetical protein
MQEPRFQNSDSVEAMHPFAKARCIEYDKSGKATPGGAQTIVDLAEEYAELLRLPSPVLPIRGTSGQVMAAMSLALQMSRRPSRVSFYMGAVSAESRAKAKSLKDEWREWRTLALATVGTPLMAAMPAMGADGYTWVRESMAPQCRVERMVAACASLRYVAGRSAGSTAPRIVMGSRGEVKKVSPNETPSCRIWSGAGHSLMDEALTRFRNGRKVVAALPVNPKKPGGLLLSGGCHGPEEDACIRSTLHPLLVAALADGAGGVTAACRALENGGAVVMPGVEVFRGSAREGYPWLDEPVPLTAIVAFTVPLPSSEGGGGNRGKLQEALLLQKFELIVSEAARLGAHCLLVSGRYASAGQLSDLTVVRRVLGAALLSVSHELEDVVLTD